MVDVPGTVALESSVDNLASMQGQVPVEAEHVASEHMFAFSQICYLVADDLPDISAHSKSITR
jgi:5'-deoxynucleotidase YfbR-like HD superfamily hydrolase